MCWRSSRAGATVYVEIKGPGSSRRSPRDPQLRRACAVHSFDHDAMGRMREIAAGDPAWDSVRTRAGQTSTSAMPNSRARETCGRSGAD